MFAVIGAEVAFVAVKPGTIPAPEATRPIPVFEFVQLNVAPPAGIVLNVFSGTATPAQ
jgi:hypothetical protein